MSSSIFKICVYKPINIDNLESLAEQKISHDITCIYVPSPKHDPLILRRLSPKTHLPSSSSSMAFWTYTRRHLGVSSHSTDTSNITTKLDYNKEKCIIDNYILP